MTPLDLLAYLDPGSGSYILQLLIAGLLGAGFAIKSYWRNIKSFFSRSSTKNSDPEQDAK